MKMLSGKTREVLLASKLLLLEKRPALS